MRRLLLTFLLVFLPLQAIWAAASPYCGHEATPQASHFGHHLHEHPVDEAASAAPVDAADAHGVKALPTTATVDMDCHACHGAGSGMVLSASAPAIVVSVAHPAPRKAPVWLHPPLSRPERPKWPALA